MKHSFLLRVLTVLIILPLFFSCKKGNNEAHTFYGPSVTMGNGIGRSIVEVGADGKPLSIGVELTKDCKIYQQSHLLKPWIMWNMLYSSIQKYSRC
jgi:hypothetical protein